MTHFKRLVYGIAPLLALSSFAQATFLVVARADESENVSSRYEDDAWYDVTEWFDGNDYNPTDEALGRWDDERFNYYDKQGSTDNDNDAGVVNASEFYGEDWDDGNASFTDADGDGVYESYARYYDADGDNLNDSYASYQDSTGDGEYETYEFSELGGNNEHDLPSSEVAQTTINGLSGQRAKVAGKITDVKYVKRLGGTARLLSVESADGESRWVDMGTGTVLGLFKGDTVGAIGPFVKAGDKNVLMATSIETRGKLLPIHREGRKYSGTITAMKVADVRGKAHTVAKLKTDEGKKLTVDLGIAAPDNKYKEGDRLDVRGVPVKLGGRVILIADTSKL